MILKNILLASMLLSFTSVFADEAKPLELPDAAQYKKVMGNSSSGFTGVKVGTFCKDKISGNEIKANEAGYEDCLRKAGTDKDANSAGVSFGTK